MSDASDRVAHILAADQGRQGEAEAVGGVYLRPGQGFSLPPGIGFPQERGAAAEGDGIVFLGRNPGLFEFGLKSFEKALVEVEHGGLSCEEIGWNWSVLSSVRFWGIIMRKNLGDGRRVFLVLREASGLVRRVLVV